MRRALIFMILFNSITCVTNNLAMETEEEKIEMKEALEALIEIPETIDNVESGDSHSGSSTKTVRHRKLKIMLAILGSVLMVSIPLGAAVESLVIYPVSGTTKISDSIIGMSNLTSPVKLHPNKNITLDLSCEYDEYFEDDLPDFYECAQGECQPRVLVPSECNKATKSNHETCTTETKYYCYIEKCQGAKEYIKKCTEALSNTGGIKLNALIRMGVLLVTAKAYGMYYIFLKLRKTA